MSSHTIKLRKPHDAQKQILTERKRFNAVKCGRRFGKTSLTDELATEIVTTTFIIDGRRSGGYVGFWTPTYKDLHEVWVQCKYTFRDIIAHISESLKELTFITGGKIQFWSMEDPDSGRGRRYHRAIVDECEKSQNFQYAWEQTIRGTLADFKGDGYFLSTPQIGLTYFKEICKNELRFDDWKTFRFPSTANPFIDPEEIEQARLLLPDAVFRTEYMAEDIDAIAVNPFAHQYRPEKHEAEVVFQPQRQIVMAMDFNMNPFAVTFSHIWRDSTWHDHQFDEMEIPNGSIPEMVSRIQDKYGTWVHAAVLTGDAMGKSGQISERDNATLYDQVLRGLRMSRLQLRVTGNPEHKNSRADVNFVLCHHDDFKINPKTCPMTCRDMRAVQCDSYGGLIKRNRQDLNQRADFLDTVRYKIHNCEKDFMRHKQTIIKK